MWGDYASERGIITGTRNGLLVHAAKLDVQKKGAKEFEIVPSGRQLMHFYYSSTCHVDDADPTNHTATGTVFLRLNPTSMKLVSKATTFVSNPTDKAQSIVIWAQGTGESNEAKEPVHVSPRSTARIVINVAVGKTSKEVEMSFSGGKGIVLVNTTFS